MTGRSLRAGKIGMLRALAAAIGAAVLLVALIGEEQGWWRSGPPLPQVKVTEGEKSLAFDLGGGTVMKFSLIPAGKFLMGSPESDTDRNEDEAPQHAVAITRPFYLGATEVTQSEFEAVMGANPSYFKGAAGPVECVSWFDAREFCRRLSEASGQTVRLPTEAEWEWACRAGSAARFSFGDDDGDLREFAWYDQNSFSAPHPVAGKKPDARGLFDMHGNVWEWCADWYGDEYYKTRAGVDPAGPASGKMRVIRGGCWANFPWDCRSAVRGREDPRRRCPYIGFRVVVEGY